MVAKKTQSTKPAAELTDEQKKAEEAKLAKEAAEKKAAEDKAKADAKAEEAAKKKAAEAKAKEEEASKQPEEPEGYNVVAAVEKCVGEFKQAKVLIKRLVHLYEVAHSPESNDATYAAASEQFAVVLNMLGRADHTDFVAMVKSLVAVIKSDVSWTKPVMTRVTTPTAEAAVFFQAMVRLAKGDVSPQTLNYKGATAYFNNEEIAQRLQSVFIKE